MTETENRPTSPSQPPQRSSVGEITALFLRLGATAFGGPAAHIALMRSEIVQRRKWLTEQQFLDLLGATNLIPGPNSTEMAIHLGLLRGGVPGMIASGGGFILPAMLIVLALAWVYVRYGSTPQAEGLFYGIQPVIIAIVFQALWNLSKAAVKGPLTAVAGIVALALFLLGFDEIALLFSIGIIVMLVKNLLGRRFGVLLAVPPLLPGIAASGLAAAPLKTVPFSLPLLFLTFLKIGSVLYGSGYVLLAFLRSDFIERLGWLTETQLLEAVAIGQFTPGPLFTTATFIGYLVGGIPGAILATVGIFLPGFLLVWLTSPVQGPAQRLIR